MMTLRTCQIPKASRGDREGGSGRLRHADGEVAVGVESVRSRRVSAAIPDRREGGASLRTLRHDPPGVEQATA